MEIRRYGSDLQDAWNRFNGAARNGHFLFDRGYMDYHADRFADASLVAFNGEAIVALMPANLRDGVVHSHQGLTFGGLVVDGLRTADVLACLDLCAAHWREAGAARLIYKPLPWIYHRRPSQEDLYWLFRRDARLVGRLTTAAVRLAQPGPRSTRRQRGAAKATRAGVTYRRSDRLDAFWRILTEVLADRHDARPVHSLDEIGRLAARFPENIALWTAELGEQMLAGVLLYRSDQVVHAQYIAASPEGRAMGALDGLFAHLLDQPWGAAFFDFGTSNEDGGRVLNEGLIRQKEEFGASVAAHDVYEISLA